MFFSLLSPRGKKSPQGSAGHFDDVCKPASTGNLDHGDELIDE
jgi:hypothetical protein